jgi:outer membrane immunogenic protein
LHLYDPYSVKILNEKSVPDASIIPKYSKKSTLSLNRDWVGNMMKNLAIIMIFAPSAAFCQDYSIKGPRAEIHVAYERATMSSDQTYSLGSSASYGAELGYDIKLSSGTSFGPFLNYEHSEYNKCQDQYCLGYGGSMAAGGRLSFKITRKSDLFFKIGYGKFKLTAQYNNQRGNVNLSGPAISIGNDWNLTKKIYVGASTDVAFLGRYAGYNFRKVNVTAILGYRFK